VRATKMKDEIILAGEKVEVIGKHGIGVDNINVPLATQRGILVVNTPEANVLSVAEHALTLMLALVKRIVPGNDALHAGKLPLKRRHSSNSPFLVCWEERSQGKKSASWEWERLAGNWRAGAKASECGLWVRPMVKSDEVKCWGSGKAL